jgi:CPA2 family monovalent cation:H+ antiporter-2
VVVLLFGRALGSAFSIAVALAQSGEFSFILASLASSLNILPAEATNALVVTSVVSITLNPLLYNASSNCSLAREKRCENEKKDIAE